MTNEKADGVPENNTIEKCKERQKERQKKVANVTGS